MRLPIPVSNWSRPKLIKELDSVFSYLVRSRDEWRCQRCQKKYEPPTSSLHCSHFWKRGYLGTRWLMNNCDAMCYGCHRLIEGDKQAGSWYYEWKLKQLGELEFEKMRIQAQAITKFSHSDLQLLLDMIEREKTHKKDY